MFLFGSINRKEKTAQDLIPLRALDGGVVITSDDRFVQILKVSTFNTELMSQNELNILLENYEAFLKSIDFQFQIETVSMPIDLDMYIRSQEELLEKTKNPYRQNLLESYIDYTKRKSSSRKIIRRHSYFILDQKIKGPTEKEFNESFHDLETKTETVINGLKELKLTAEKIKNIEATKLFQVFFNYEASLHLNINPDIIQKKTSKIPQENRGNRILRPKVVK